MLAFHSPSAFLEEKRMNYSQLSTVARSELVKKVSVYPWIATLSFGASPRLSIP
jgi:hypothetical protein